MAMASVAACGQEGQSVVSGRQTFQQPPVRIRTQEVLLDIIINDRKGRPVRDLKPSEIEVFEDGVRQPISRFAVIGPAIKHSQPSPTTANSTDLPERLNLVTIVFDHLTVQRVQPVREAAFNFIDTSITGDMLVRVMVIGRKLYAIEHFTSDRAKLRKAIERATVTVEQNFEEISDQLASDLRLVAAGNNPEDTQVAPEPRAGKIRVMLARLTLDALTASEKLSSENGSNLPVFSLLPLARAHRLAPGRKMALYFSDGLYMPRGASGVLRAVVSEANLANLSFYAINIRNLIAGAGNQVSRLESSTVINQTRRPETSTYNSALADSYSVSDRVPGRTQLTTNFNMFEVIDRNKEINKQGPLSELTEGTGGFLITSINDLNGALKRIATELGNYYSVSYLPSRLDFDGKFRSIAVKVLRSGLKAQTRSGYFAIPPSTESESRPVLPYETPMLAALNDAVVPHDFDFGTGTLFFESRQNEVHTVVLVELPLAGFVHEVDKEKNAYPLGFAVMGMVKDDKGEVVYRFSEPHQLEVPANVIEDVKRSSMTLTRHFWLMPGLYTLETVANDTHADKISAQRLTFRVPVRGSALQTSSLFLIKQIEKIVTAGNADPDNPLIVQDKKITPGLDKVIRPTLRDELMAQLTIYPGIRNPEKTTLSLDLEHEGRLIASTVNELSKHDDQGRIVFTAGIPISGLPAGSYRLHTLARQGESSARNHLDFAIAGERTNEDKMVITSSITASDTVGALTLHALRDLQPIELSASHLLAEVETAGARIYPLLGDYTYSLRKVRRILNSKGRIRNEVYQDYEAYPVNGQHALIQLAENGSRLSMTSIEISRRSATNILIRNEAQRQGLERKEDDFNRKIGYWGASIDGLIHKRGQPRRNVFITIDPEIFFDSCDVSSPRSVILEGRQTIVLDFYPRPGVQLDQDKDWILKLAGTIWIDVFDKSLVRIEGHRSQSASTNDSADPPISFVYQQRQLAPGIWAPSLIRINSAGDESLFHGLNWDAWFEFSNYRRFDARDSGLRIVSPGHQ